MVNRTKKQVYSDKIKNYYDEKKLKLKKLIHDTDKEIMEHRESIKILNKKQHAQKYELSTLEDEFLLTTNVDMQDIWKGKRRPTGFK